MIDFPSKGDPTEDTRRALQAGWRPFPRTHSLPVFIEGFIAFTRGPYDGEPREAMRMLDKPTHQFWARRWVDIVVELWAGPIHLEGEPRRAQRDEVLGHVQTLWTSAMKARIVDAYTEDLRAVRDVLKPIISGPLPQLLIDIEGKTGGPTPFT